jgi:RNA polymerase sigma-70 factor (ECF subfamily)
MGLIRNPQPERSSGQDEPSRFEEAILPHLDAAYNLARWLTRNDQDAEDMVQEACLRAFKSFDGFYGVKAKAWLLTIVRNTCYTWLGKNRTHDLSPSLDEDVHQAESQVPDPQTLLLRFEDNQALRKALEELPAEFREVLILRELEELSYKEIADVTGIPPGTVMSRLARARGRLKLSLADRMNKER